MVETTAALGDFTELVENDAGESVLRNTDTGTEIKLADFIDIVGPLGSESDPVAGTSHFEALSAESSLTKSKGATITVWKSDGGTVYWDGNGKNVSSGSAGSFGVAMNEAIKALPGGNDDDKEAHGLIHIDGSPPSHYVLDQTVGVEGGLEIEMDGVEHHPQDGIGFDHTSESYIEVTSNAGSGFAPVDIDNENIPGVRIKGLSVYGPGTTTGAMIDESAGSNRYDLLDVIDCYGANFDRALNLTDSDSISVVRGHYFRTGREAIYTTNPEAWISPKSTFDTCKEDTNSAAITNRGTTYNTQILQSHGDGIRAVSGVVMNCDLGNLDIDGVGVTGAMLAIGNTFGSGASQYHLSTSNTQPGFGRSGRMFAWNDFAATPDVADIEEHGNIDTSIWHSDADITIDDNGTRTRFNGVIGGGPLGGVDISTITGATEGDIARTVGASAAPADVIAMFDGIDWIYPTKGGAVTPA